MQTRTIFAIVAAMSLAVPLLIIEASAQMRDEADRAPAFTPRWAAPQLDVLPRSGIPGSIVRIIGGEFRPGVRVFFGDQPMRIIEHDDELLVARVPDYVRATDFIYVIDRTGRARTATPFVLDGRPDYYPGEPYFEEPFGYDEAFPGWVDLDRGVYDWYERDRLAPREP